MAEERKNDEIDLIEVAQKTAKLAGKAGNKLLDLIVLILKSIYTAIIFSIRFLYKNSILIIIFVIAGYILGTLYISNAKPYYRTTATIQSNVISNSNLISYINRLNTLAENNDSTSLAEQLNIPVHAAAQIFNLEAFWMIDKNQDGIADEIDYDNKFIPQPDSISIVKRINDKFIVQLETFDNTIITDVQTGLESFIGTYPRIDKIADVKKTNLQTEVNRLSSEIKVLDSLRNYEYFEKQRELIKQDNKVLKLNELLLQVAPEDQTEPKLLHNDILELDQKYLDGIKNIELETDPFVFLSDFIKVNNPVDIEEDTGLRMKITFLFFIFSIFIAAFMRYRKSIFRFLKAN